MNVIRAIMKEAYTRAHKRTFVKKKKKERDIKRKQRDRAQSLKENENKSLYIFMRSCFPRKFTQYD